MIQQTPHINRLIGYACYRIDRPTGAVSFMGHAGNIREARRLVSGGTRGFWGRWYYANRGTVERQNFHLRSVDIGKNSATDGWIERLYAAENTAPRSAMA
jgi:hypothetical protein